MLRTLLVFSTASLDKLVSMSKYDNTDEEDKCKWLLRENCRVDHLRVGGERDIGPGQIGGVRPCGSSSTKVAGTCLLVLVLPFWLLFSGVWETLIFGTGDWFAFGEPFFCGLFTPTYPLPGHRLVPESQVISGRTCVRA